MNATSTTYFTLNLMSGNLSTKRELQDGQMCKNIHQAPRTRQAHGPRVSDCVIFTPKLFCCFSRTHLIRALYKTHPLSVFPNCIHLASGTVCLLALNSTIFTEATDVCHISECMYDLFPILVVSTLGSWNLSLLRHFSVNILLA